MENRTFTTRAPTHWPFPRTALILLSSGVVLVACLLVSLSSGYLNLSLETTALAVWHGLSGHSLEGNEAIVWNMRLPRAAFGALVGASLAVAGTALQGLFRNPLADPYLTGTASGAALGATLAIFATGGAAGGFAASFFRVGIGSSLIPIFAFVGAVGAVLLTLLFARLARGGPNSLILAGVVVGSLLGAITTFVQLHDADRMRAAFSWALGSLTLAGWSELRAVLPFALLGFFGLMALARALDALQLGDDTASSLGLKLPQIKLALVGLAALLTASSVSYAGLIGFVGLVAPHLCRLLIGPSHRLLLPMSALGGATLLVLADWLARVVTSPQEQSVGLITTLIGAPFFLWLMARGKK
jgi:iron complex transport system permease protein